MSKNSRLRQHEDMLLPYGGNRLGNALGAIWACFAIFLEWSQADPCGLKRKAGSAKREAGSGKSGGWTDRLCHRGQQGL